MAASPAKASRMLTVTLPSDLEITLTRSRNTAFTASCQDQIDSGKYDRGRKSALSTSA